MLSVYNYDDFGNIKTIQNFAGTVGSVTNYTYDRNNRLTSRFVDGIKTEYSYDRQGNLVAEKDEVGSTAYHYNGFNRLTNVYGNNLDATYTYDHTGLRTSKNVNGVHTRLINDGQNVVAQYVDGKSSHFYRGSSLIGYTNSSCDVNFYQFNAHGDVVSVLDCFGNTVKNYDYDAFGKQKDDIDSFYRNQYGIEIDDNPFRYCGEYFDDETGLIYLRARYYDPGIQRFLAEDTHWNPDNIIYGDNPIELTLDFDELVELINRNTLLPVFSIIVQTANRYVYCINNPTGYFDYSGELAFPGEIHNLVVDHIANKYNLKQEQRIDYDFGWGRADLIDAKTGEVWEVKREKTKQIISGWKQVEKYVANTWHKHKNVTLKLGGPIECDSFKFTSGFDTYYVSYRYIGNGVIAYDYKKTTDWEEVREFGVNVAVGAWVVTKIGITISSGGAIPAFAFA